MNYAAFFAFTFLTAYTPGPNNLIAMTNASRDGLKRTLPFLSGMVSGFLFVMLICALFSTLLYDLIPSIKPYMLALGTCYLLYLAYSVWQDKPHKEGKQRQNSFLAGLLLQLVNVKIMLYGITAITSYVLPYYQKTEAIISFCVLLTAIGASGFLCWAGFGSLIERLFKEHKKILNIIMALLLVYCAVSLFL